MDPIDPAHGQSTPARSGDGKLDELELLLHTLPRRTSYLSRVLYRTRGSALPRGMRSVVFTLAFGPMRISEIAWEEGIGQPAATRMVARLEALGLVRRERSETDKRIVMVALTKRGRTELENLREQSRKLLRGALQGRSAADLRRMRAASEALALLTDWVLEQEGTVYGASKRQPAATAVKTSSKRQPAAAAVNGAGGRAPAGAH
ncbi:MAG: MarR family winged helix-turn-helix transcriptional regulator, partial [Solirubrobacteraceae bacterium]